MNRGMFGKRQVKLTFWKSIPSAMYPIYPFKATVEVSDSIEVAPIHFAIPKSVTWHDMSSSSWPQVSSLLSLRLWIYMKITHLSLLTLPQLVCQWLKLDLLNQLDMSLGLSTSQIRVDQSAPYNTSWSICHLRRMHICCLHFVILVSYTIIITRIERGILLNCSLIRWTTGTTKQVFVRSVFVEQGKFR